MRLRACVIAALLASGCSTPRAAGASAPATACEFGAQAELIPVENPGPGERNERLDVPNTPAWWGPAPMNAEREHYRAALVARLGEAALLQPALLERQRALYAAMVGKSSRREAENTGRVLDGSAGTVGPATCLEWRLLERQAHRYPLLERPTEFYAYVLRGHGRIRMYVSAGDSAGGKLRHEVRDRVVRDVKDGWEPVAHLHNHPFMFDRVVGDRLYTTEDTREDLGGALAPSLTDVQAYRQMREHFGLRGAWLTNGLDSIHYSAGDFDRLSAWE